MTDYGPEIPTRYQSDPLHVGAPASPKTCSAYADDISPETLHPMSLSVIHKANTITLTMHDFNGNKITNTLTLHDSDLQCIVR